MVADGVLQFSGVLAAGEQVAPPAAVAVKREPGGDGGAATDGGGGGQPRRDDSYWDRRRRNNEAAKRSRQKRRFNDMMLETRVAELTKDNFLLRAQLNTIRDKFGIVGEQHIDAEQVLAQLPPVERIVGLNKRPKTAGRLLQLGSCGDGSASRQLRPPTPPSAPVRLCSEPAPLLYRQQSLREPAAGDAQLWRAVSTAFAAAAPDERRRSPPAAAAAADWCTLPLKLRHKQQALRDEARAVKSEPAEWASSGDERDWAVGSDGTASPPAPPPPPAGAEIRSQLARLSSEVATLRSLLSRPAGSPSPST